VDVTAAVAPLEIVARYEAPFRLAGFHIGWVTTSSLAALELVPNAGLKVLAKLTGRVLSLGVLNHGVLKLIRSIELSDCTAQEIVGHLFPTFAYIEDQLSASPDTLLVCGFGAATQESGDTPGSPEWTSRSPEIAGVSPGSLDSSERTRAWLEAQLGVRTVPLASAFGQPGELNAGLLGYLEMLKET
jgi:type IV pilus assembly protein PilM